MHRNVWLAESSRTSSMWSIVKYDWLKAHVHLQTALWRNGRGICLKNMVLLPVIQAQLALFSEKNNNKTQSVCGEKYVNLKWKFENFG